jgi:fructose-bisphosphate aldolase class I
MHFQNLEEIAKALVADGKGILAADETVGTLTKRFDQLRIPSTPESRRDYRELLFTTPGSDAFISGVIMYDETIRQQASNGKPLVEGLIEQGIIPGIKVDTGAKPLAGCQDETVTEGLDGLRERLQDYHALGARFAKWRAVIRISDQLPSQTCISVNAHALGRYAALCQEQGMVPVVEPEVLVEGAHTLDRCYAVTSKVQHAVFNALNEQKVSLEGMLLKPNMILSGSLCPTQASMTEVADATLRCLLAGC